MTQCIKCGVLNDYAEAPYTCWSCRNVWSDAAVTPTRVEAMVIRAGLWLRVNYNKVCLEQREYTFPSTAECIRFTHTVPYDISASDALYLRLYWGDKEMSHCFKGPLVAGDVLTYDLRAYV